LEKGRQGSASTAAVQTPDAAAAGRGTHSGRWRHRRGWTASTSCTQRIAPAPRRLQQRWRHWRSQRTTLKTTATRWCADAAPPCAPPVLLLLKLAQGADFLIGGGLTPTSSRTRLQQRRPELPPAAASAAAASGGASAGGGGWARAKNKSSGLMAVRAASTMKMRLHRLRERQARPPASSDSFRCAPGPPSATVFALSLLL